jgi:hypothetical protein
MVCWFCTYNHIDKHLRDRAMQQSISSEFRCGHLLCFEEAFDEDKVSYDKTKVCKLKVSDLLSYVFFLLLLVCFPHSHSNFVCMLVLILLRK